MADLRQHLAQLRATSIAALDERRAWEQAASEKDFDASYHARMAYSAAKEELLDLLAAMESEGALVRLADLLPDDAAA